jgi:hypothetical protein
MLLEMDEKTVFHLLNNFILFIAGSAKLSYKDFRLLAFATDLLEEVGRVL